jgi:hypothetical protein
MPAYWITILSPAATRSALRKGGSYKPDARVDGSELRNTPIYRAHLYPQRGGLDYHPVMPHDMTVIVAVSVVLLGLWILWHFRSSEYRIRGVLGIAVLLSYLLLLHFAFGFPSFPVEIAKGGSEANSGPLILALFLCMTFGMCAEYLYYSDFDQARRAIERTIVGLGYGGAGGLTCSHVERASDEGALSVFCHRQRAFETARRTVAGFAAILALSGRNKKR